MNSQNDWKSTLGEFFAANDTFRKEYLEKLIERGLKTYAAYLHTFNGVRTQIEPYQELNGKACFMVLIVHMKHVKGGTLFEFPFKMGIRVESGLDITLEYTAALSLAHGIKDVIKGVAEGKDLYRYESDVLSDAERFDEEWLFQVFNRKLINYVESSDATLKR